MSSFYNTPWSLGAVNVNYAGISLNEGGTADTYCTVTYTTPEIFSTTVDMNGDVAVSMNSDTSGTMAFTFVGSSDTCRMLSNLYSAMKHNAASDNPVFKGLPISVIEPSGVITTAAYEAALMSKSELTLSKEVGTVTFTFYVADIFGVALPVNLAAGVAGAVGQIGAGLGSFTVK